MNKDKLTVCVVFGGESSEHEVSLRSAYSILSCMDTEKYIIYRIGITRDGAWLLFNGENMEIAEDTWHENEKNESLCVDFSEKCFKAGGRKISPEVIFPIMHGEYGEDGRVQSLCELLHIKKVGIPSDSAVLCMDKEISKTIAMRQMIPVVPYIAVERGRYSLDRVCEEIGQSAFDVFVKPTRGGSSVGISRARSRAELAVALDNAHKCSEIAIVEEAIIGTECEVAILEQDGKIIVSEVGELSYKSDFYDYETKYHSDGVRYKIPAKIPDTCRNLCKRYAKELFCALHCHGMSRVDFFVTKNEQVYFNEINAIPGFTRGSMYPMLMSHMGYEMSEIVDILIENAK